MKLLGLAPSNLLRLRGLADELKALATEVVFCAVDPLPRD